MKGTIMESPFFLSTHHHRHYNLWLLTKDEGFFWKNGKGFLIIAGGQDCP